VDVFFAPGRVDHECRTRAAREERWGSAAAPIVGRRLFELAALPRLSDALSLPGVRLRSYAGGDRYDVKCNFGIRMIVVPVDDRGSILNIHADATRVTAIRVELLEFDSEGGA